MDTRSKEYEFYVWSLRRTSRIIHGGMQCRSVKSNGMLAEDKGVYIILFSFGGENRIFRFTICGKFEFSINGRIMRKI